MSHSAHASQNGAVVGLELHTAGATELSHGGRGRERERAERETAIEGRERRERERERV